MLRRALPAIIAVALAITACGGSGGNSACDQALHDARAWAQNYAQNLPNPISQNTIEQLAESTYNATVTGDAKYAGCKTF